MYFWLQLVAVVVFLFFFFHFINDQIKCVNTERCFICVPMCCRVDCNVRDGNGANDKGRSIPCFSVSDVYLSQICIVFYLNNRSLETFDCESKWPFIRPPGRPFVRCNANERAALELESNI